MAAARSWSPARPEDVAREKRSYTGQFLKEVLERGKRTKTEAAE